MTLNITFLFFITSFLCQKVPYVNDKVTIDGKKNENEWMHYIEKKIDNIVTLKLTQNDSLLYLKLQIDNQAFAGWCDLYIKDNGVNL